MLGSILIMTQDAEAGIAAMTGLQAGATQVMINHTRANESEADRVGISTLANAGFNPDGMTRFFQKMLECLTLPFLATIGAFFACIYRFLQHRQASQRAQRQEQWNGAGKDVAVLHQMPRATFCPSPSPYPIKLETFLRAAGIKYVNDFNDFTSPKGKTPWITFNGSNISDSQLAMQHLTKKLKALGK